MTSPIQKHLPKILAAAAIGAVIFIVRGFLTDEKPTPAPETTGAPTAATTPAQPVGTGLPPSLRPPTSASAPAEITSGQAMELTTALSQTKKVAAVKAALATGDAKKALEEIDDYDKFPEPRLLKEEMTVLKIQALAKSGRRTDALALAMSTRDDPAFSSYQQQIDAVVSDAGLR